jgi:glycosyltransferase involved in cell wall biosynthesis
VPAIVFLIPGRLETRTGGYEYDRRMIAGLRSLGWTVVVEGLDGSFPLPTDTALDEADRVLARLPDGASVLIDGLALGAMPDQAARASGRLLMTALVHHPLADETGLAPDVAARLRASERLALAAVTGVVVTSSRTAEVLRDSYDVPRGRIAVVEPGTSRAPLARGSGGASVEFLCVASLSPRKGHDVLIRALGPLADRRWTLTAVGGSNRDPGTVGRLEALVETVGLTGRVQLRGEADRSEVDAYYERSDVFVLPTYYEGYGMVIAEALARGLPVISTPTGAIPELVAGGAGLLVAPGDVAGWTAALARMLDPDERRRFGEGARARRESLPTWEDAARRLADALSVRRG